MKIKSLQHQGNIYEVQSEHGSGTVAESCPIPVKRMGVNDELGHSGLAEELLKEFGLSGDHIAKEAIHRGR